MMPSMEKTVLRSQQGRRNSRRKSEVKSAQASLIPSQSLNL